MITKSALHALLLAGRGASLSLVGLIVLMQVHPHPNDENAYESGLNVLYVLGSWPWILAVSVGAVMSLWGGVECWRHASSKPRL